NQVELLAQVEQGACGDSCGGTVERLAPIIGRAKIPRRDQSSGSTPPMALRAPVSAAGKGMDPPQPGNPPKAVHRPRASAGPGAVRPVTVLRGLALELSRRHVEDRLVGRAAVGADQVLPACSAVLEGDLAKGLIPGGARSPKDDADVHHDVDEQRMRAQKGS